VDFQVMVLSMQASARYYQAKYKILERAQLWPQQSLRAREQEELLASVGITLQ
jgi:hypothetical protein